MCAPEPRPAAISLAVVLLVLAFAAWAFLPAKYLPGNRARYLRVGLYLRLHPGKGFATVVALHPAVGRLAALRRLGRIRPSLPWWVRASVASKLCGQAAWKIRGHYHATWHDIATPDMIRQLPAGFALVIRSGYAPTIVRLPKGVEQPRLKKARRLGPLAAVEGVAGLVASSVLPSGRPVLPVIPDHVPDDLIIGDDDTFPWN